MPRTVTFLSRAPQPFAITTILSRRPSLCQSVGVVNHRCLLMRKKRYVIDRYYCVIIPRDVTTFEDCHRLCRRIDLNLVFTKSCELERINEVLIRCPHVHHGIDNLGDGRLAGTRILRVLKGPFQTPENTRARLVFRCCRSVEAFGVLKRRLNGHAVCMRLRGRRAKNPATCAEASPSDNSR